MKIQNWKTQLFQLSTKLDVEKDFSNIENCYWLPSKGPKRVINFPNEKMQTAFGMLRKT